MNIKTDYGATAREIDDIDWHARLKDFLTAYKHTPSRHSGGRMRHAGLERGVKG